MTPPKIRPTLLRTLLYGPLRAAVVNGIVLTGVTLIQHDVLTWHDPYPLILLVLTSITFGAAMVGSAHRYTMTRGFSSACLWAHAALAGLLALGVATIPPALVIWTGFRSHTQAFNNPLFPLMRPVEYIVPLFWLAAGAILMIAALFGAIRAAQPGGTRAAGLFVFLVVSGVLATILGGFPHLGSWQLWLAAVPLLLVSLILLIGSRSLHRSMEVL